MKKHLIVSLSISACLLLPSAGVVFAADPHLLVPNSTGQPGTGGVNIQCGGTAGGSVTPLVTLPNGQMGSGSNSPFVNTSKPYAGAGPNPNRNGNPPSVNNYGANSPADPNAAASYDVACYQATHQVP